MVLFSIGLPSRLAEWCDRLVAQLAERSSNSIETTAINSLEELAVAVIRTRASNLVACSRSPVPRLQNEIAQADIPIVVALGDPRAALRHLVDHAGYAVSDAARAVASSCAAMLAMTKAPRALVLSPDDAADRRAVAAAVADQFSIRLEPTELSRLVAGLPDAGLEREEADGQSWLTARTEREQTMVAGALDPYIACFGGADLERLIWEPELFFVAADPPTPEPLPASGPIEITGRVRFLAYGPFISLPAGPWVADVVLGFSAEAAGMSFLIEIFAGAQLAHTRVTATGEDVIEARLAFTIGSDVDQPVQVRICNERAAFDGRMALAYVTMTPQEAISDETRARLTRTLRL